MSHTLDVAETVRALGKQLKRTVATRGEDDAVAIGGPIGAPLGGRLRDESLRDAAADVVHPQIFCGVVTIRQDDAVAVR